LELDGLSRADHDGVGHGPEPIGPPSTLACRHSLKALRGPRGGPREGETLMRIDLTDRTAGVTGSTGGIGFAIAEALAETGATVVVNGRSQESVDAAVARLRQAPSAPDVTGAAADAPPEQGAERLGGGAGRRVVPVNNLRIFGAGEALDITDDEWRRYFEVNVLSAVRLTRLVLPDMVERSWGRVLNIASDSAI